MNEYSWHESLRRLARGVSSLHQHQNTEGKKKKKEKRKKGERAQERGVKEGEKKGGGRQTDTHFR